MRDEASMGISQIGCSIYKSLSGCQILQSYDKRTRNPPSPSHQKLKKPLNRAFCSEKLGPDLSVQVNQSTESRSLEADFQAKPVSTLSSPDQNSSPSWTLKCSLPLAEKRGLPEEESRIMVDFGLGLA